MGGASKDPVSALQHRTQAGQQLPTPQQVKECLAELHEMDNKEGGGAAQQQQQQHEGSAGSSLLTKTPECPATVARPVRKDLEEKGLYKPGVARASVAPSLEHPEGRPEGPHLKLGKHRTVMQQHVDFFDRDGDGIISMWDTYVGFRKMGFNIPFSLWAVFVINPAFSLVSSPGWLPDPFLRVFTSNIHRGKHGSDQEVYDHEGRFIPQRFEDLWSKWDVEGKGGLTTGDIWTMTQGTFEVNDFFGWFAGKFEWYTSWLVAADEEGLLRKEAVRAIYDGSLFYLLEDKYSKGATLPPEYQGMGDGATLSAIWSRYWGGGKDKTTTNNKKKQQQASSSNQTAAEHVKIH